MKPRMLFSPTLLIISGLVVSQALVAGTDFEVASRLDRLEQDSVPRTVAVPHAVERSPQSRWLIEESSGASSLIRERTPRPAREGIAPQARDLSPAPGQLLSRTAG